MVIVSWELETGRKLGRGASCGAALPCALPLPITILKRTLNYRKMPDQLFEEGCIDLSPPLDIYL